mgnify:CR=1 FL=1
MNITKGRKKMRQLTIDPEFRDKIPPLSQDEISKLEENILADGEVREPLVLWHNTIIDGHHRWAIIQKHPEIPYKVTQMDFPDKWAAIVWMCRNQLGRRNVTDEQKTVLIGEAYRAQKMTVGASDGFRGNQYSKVVNRQNGDIPETSKTETIIAKQFGVGSGTVARAKRFVDSLDEAEKVSPGFRESVLSGAVKAPKSVIAEIRNVPEENRAEVVEAIKRGDTDTAKAIIKPKPIPVQEESRPEFDADDFNGVLAAAVKAFDEALEMHMILAHPEMLDCRAGREAASKALTKAKAIIEKYEKLIKEKKEKNNDG